MDKLLEVKKTVTALMAALSAFLGWMGWLVVLYAVSMGIDYLTGSALAAKNGDWQSQKAREGLWHKAGSILAVIVAALADFLLGLVLEKLPLSLPFTYTVLLCPVVLVWYIVTELGSIVENAGALGAPIPAFLQAAIKSLNQAVDGSDPKE